MSVADEFKLRVTEHLEEHTDKLVDLLKHLVSFPHVPEVRSLDFEVFCDSFTDRFPVRVYFMDADNCEYFIYENGKATYPCDVDPDLLGLDGAYGSELEEEFEERDPDLDIYTIAGEALIPWFARCWLAAGGADFPREAFIGLHDGLECFDLVKQTWIGT